jgi:uncharacterized protein
MLTVGINVTPFISMSITFDPNKRAATLAHRGLDFAAAARGFVGDHATWIDECFDYGGVRQITAGLLDGRMVGFIWTQRGPHRHVLSMGHCHDKEARKIRRRFGLPRPGAMD